MLKNATMGNATMGNAMMLGVLSLLSKPSMSYFDPEADAAAAKAKAEAEAEAKKNEKIYSQADLDKHVGGFKFGMKKELEKAAAEAAKLAEDKRLTQEERDQYAKQRDDLESQYKTQKELEEQRVKKLQDDHKKQLETAQGDVKVYKSKYATLLTDTSLLEAVATADEVIPGQLKKFLKPDTFLTDELDESGKATGNQVVKVNFDDVDAAGKAIKLVLSPSEAIKRMKELPERFGNFFKGVGVGGVGAANGKGGAAAGSMPSDTGAYIAQRKAQNKAG